jgi:hypothetical protein
VTRTLLGSARSSRYRSGSEAQSVSSQMEPMEGYSFRSTDTPPHAVQSEELRAAGATHHNVQTPLGRLPSEILHHIISILVYSHRPNFQENEPLDIDAPVSTTDLCQLLVHVTAVCSRIRAISLANPTFWTHIDLSHDARWIQLAAARARERPLSISYTMLNYAVSARPLLARAQDVCVSVPAERDALSIREELNLFKNPWPSLRSLVCVGTSSNMIMLSQRLLAGQTHLLTKLVLCRFGVRVDEMAFPALLDLDLARCKIVGNTHPFNLLRATPSLQRLCLRRNIYDQLPRRFRWALHNPPPVPPITLSQLTAVVLKERAEVLVRLLEALPVPHGASVLVVSDYPVEGIPPPHLLSPPAMRRLAHDICSRQYGVVVDSTASAPEATLSVTSGLEEFSYTLKNAANLSQTVTFSDSLLDCWYVYADVLAATTVLHLGGDALSHLPRGTFPVLEKLIIHVGSSLCMTSPERAVRDLAEVRLESWLCKHAQNGYQIPVVDFQECAESIREYITQFARRIFGRRTVGAVFVDGQPPGTS